MALNEIGIHFYEKEINSLLDSEDREIIIGKFVDLQSTIDDLYVELQDRARRISELESELTKKETLLKMREEFCEECKEKSIIEKLKATQFIEEPLPFSSDEYEECLEEELEDLRDRHQQDCITINQLQTTIDTLVDRYAKLREMRGL